MSDIDTAALTDEELADLIHKLSNELGRRARMPKPGESWLKHQLRAASLTVRSWPRTKQDAMRGFLE